MDEPKINSFLIIVKLEKGNLPKHKLYYKYCLS